MMYRAQTRAFTRQAPFHSNETNRNFAIPASDLPGIFLLGLKPILKLMSRFLASLQIQFIGAFLHRLRLLISSRFLILCCLSVRFSCCFSLLAK